MQIVGEMHVDERRRKLNLLATTPPSCSCFAGSSKTVWRACLLEQGGWELKSKVLAWFWEFLIKD